MEDRAEWHPSAKEVGEILAELRPLISEMARRDRVEMEELRRQLTNH